MPARAAGNCTPAPALIVAGARRLKSRKTFATTLWPVSMAVCAPIAFANWWKPWGNRTHRNRLCGELDRKIKKSILRKWGAFFMVCVPFLVVRVSK